MIVRDFRRETFNVRRTFRPWADEAHVAAQHIPKLRQLVEIPPAHERADAQQAVIVACGALLGGVGGMGVRYHAAQLPKSECAMRGADSGLLEEYRRTRRLAFDEDGESGNDRRGENQTNG